MTIKVTDAEDAGTVELSQIGPQENRAVVATLSDPDGSEVITKWQWQYVDGPDCTVTSGWANIPGATSGSYTPKDFTAADGTTAVTIVGDCLRATATYTDGIVSTEGTNTEPDTATQATEAAVQASHADNSAPKFPDQDAVTPGDQSDSTSRSVAENTKAGEAIGAAVGATDADSTTTGRLDKLLYTLSGADEDSFSIERTSGQLKTKAKLDYETKNTYTVTVTATDPSGASDTITVTINVTDVDDGATISLGPAVNTPPAFDSATASFSVDENAPAGTPVGAVEATDDDPGDSVTYSDDSVYFDVDSSGNISTTMMLDHEERSTRTVAVTATDGKDIAVISVSVTVNDAHSGCTDVGNIGLTNDCEALLDAKETLEGGGSPLNWSADTDIAEWNGIQGHKQFPSLSGSPMRVTALHLQKRGLDGVIPAALGRLDALTYLNVHSNSLHGDLSALGSSENLVRIYANNNELDGIGDLSGASSLEILGAHRNPTMMGESVPTDLPASLTWLMVYDNKLTGGIPDLTHLTSLERLYLHDNDLGGTIPASLGTMTSLTHIQLKGAGLTGAIPAELGSLPNLKWLSLYGNDLAGAIPGELGDLSSLEVLYLHSNSLSGSVPSELGNLSNLTNLWLKKNSLSGGLPSSLDNLTNLERVRISGNNFRGCIPAALANAPSTDAAALGLPTCQ